MQPMVFDTSGQTPMMLNGRCDLQHRWRSRVFAAIIQNRAILMVRHHRDGQVYWTLPGGGVEPGETREAAVMREVYEETGLITTVSRVLFEADSEACFLLACRGTQQPVLGVDPEEAHLPEEARMLRAVAWRPLAEVVNDIQVSQVLAALGQNVAPE